MEELGINYCRCSPTHSRPHETILSSIDDIVLKFLQEIWSSRVHCRPFTEDFYRPTVMDKS